MAQTKIKAGLFEGIIGNGTDGYFLMSNGDGTMTWSSVVLNPTITDVDYPGTATAADPAGGETITLTGTGFKTGATVTVGGTSAPSVSYVSETQITFTTPAKTAGDYDIVVTNTDTGSATFINGISFNGIPAWTTAAGSLGTFASGATISTITLQATEPDAGTITFNITNGALPTGLSLTGANIDGTTSILNADTLYTFTVTATDDENQATPRTFTITVKKEFISSENFTINTYTGNGSTQSIEGKIGTAARFTSSYIDIPVEASSFQSKSVSFWFRYDPSQQTNSSGYCGIWQEAITLNSPFNGLQIWSSYFNNGTLTVRTRSGLETTVVTPTANQWYHLCVTYDTVNGAKIYLDGTLNSTISDTTDLSGIQYSRIGANFNASSQYYLGDLDQFRLFNKALSSSEVTTLYGESNTSTTKSTTDIFDDGSGVALYEFEKGAIDTGGVSGYIGSGGIFNGSSSKISIGDFFDFSTESFSISCWVKLNSLSATQSVFSQWSSTSTNRALLSTIDTSGTFAVLEGHGSSNNGGSNPSSTTTLTTNTWYHLVYTRSGTEGTIYVNGSEEDRNSLGNTINNSTADFQLGMQESSSKPFNGTIDQVRIFNKALSSSEVTTLYGETSASATKSTTDIFDDGSGIALYELEGNANDTGSDNGKFGKAAIFNGNGYIALDGLQTSSNMSVSFWMKTQSTMTTYQMILELSNGYGINRPSTAANGKIYAQYANSNAAHVASNSTLPVGEWVHVVGTFTSSSANLYINNVSQSGGTITDYLTADQNTIGSRRSDGFFTGSIDDVRIYSDILTTTEIGYLYNNDTANIPTGNLIAYYKLDGNSTDEQGSYDGVDTNVSYAYNGTATNVSYAYDGTPTNVSFVGTAFQPDLVWIKNRDAAVDHRLFDSIRGSYLLAPNTTGNEALTTQFSSFDSNGFTLGGGASNYNSLNNDYVAWCFKGGGTAVSNTDGSITSSVSANQDAGFSIVKYTGNGTTGATVGHGLLQEPDMIIVKNLDSATGWEVYVNGITLLDTNFLQINTDGALGTSTFSRWDVSAMSSTVFGLTGTSNVTNNTNQASNNFIAYCFHSVTGYQKIGSYTGTGTTGNVINVGFKPRFLMWKKTNGAVGWFLLDGVRNTTDVWSARLEAHSSGAESGPDAFTVTVSSTGFEMTGSFASWTGSNELNSNYIYLAIA